MQFYGNSDREIVDANKLARKENLPKLFVEYLKKKLENQQINAFKLTSGNFQITRDKIKMMQEEMESLKKEINEIKEVLKGVSKS